jgi:hypothetical protein
MTDEDRAECIPIILKIQADGGPDKTDDETRKEAMGLNLLRKERGGHRYTIKGNTLRGEMVSAYGNGGGTAPHPTKQGHVVDAKIGQHIVRGKVKGKVGDLTVIDHHDGSGVQPVAVQDEALEEVDRGTL